MSVMDKMCDQTMEEVYRLWPRFVTRQGRKCVGHGQDV